MVWLKVSVKIWASTKKEMIRGERNKMHKFISQIFYGVFKKWFLKGQQLICSFIRTDVMLSSSTGALSDLNLLFPFKVSSVVFTVIHPRLSVAILSLHLYLSSYIPFSSRVPVSLSQMLFANISQNMHGAQNPSRPVFNFQPFLKRNILKWQKSPNPRSAVTSGFVHCSAKKKEKTGSLSLSSFLPPRQLHIKTISSKKHKTLFKVPFRPSARLSFPPSLLIFFSFKTQWLEKKKKKQWLVK